MGIMKKQWIFLGVGLIWMVSVAFAECTIGGEVRHRFLRAGWKSGAIEVFDREGNTEWRIPCSDEISDAWALPDGGAVYSFSRRKLDEAGVIRVDKSHNKMWEYRLPKGHDNHSCQPLSHGGFLIGDCSKDGLWMVELNRNGKVIRRVRVGDGTPKYHHSFRQVRKTLEGTYLATIMYENKTYEWDANGKLIRTFPNGVFVAIRLPNGNTLTTGKSGGPQNGPVVEFDRNGKVIWKLTQEDLPFHLNMPCGLHYLPNGHIVISNVWHGKGTDKSAPMLYEITRDKKVVWTFTYPEKGNMGNVQILDIPGNVYKGEVLK